jgi:hypothetical protein
MRILVPTTAGLIALAVSGLASAAMIGPATAYNVFVFGSGGVGSNQNGS